MEPKRHTTDTFIEKFHELSFDDHKYKGFNRFEENKIDPKELLTLSVFDGEVKIGSNECLRVLKFYWTKNQKKKTPKRQTHKLIGKNLLDGFDKYERPELEAIYSLANSFQSLKHLTKGMPEKSVYLRTKVLTLRRVLMVILLSPLKPFQVNHFKLVYFKGFIAIFYDHDFSSKNSDEVEISKRSQELSYMGLNFESVVTSPKSFNMGEYYSFLSQKIGNRQFLYTSEIDACLKEDSSAYVELKTHKSTNMNDVNLRRKLISAWCQAKLGCTRNIVIGFRSTDDKLTSIKKYETSKLPSIVNEYRNSYSCGELIKNLSCRLSHFIQEVESSVKENEVKAFRIEQSWNNLEHVDTIVTKELPKNESNELIGKSIPMWVQEILKE